MKSHQLLFAVALLLSTVMLSYGGFQVPADCTCIGPTNIACGDRINITTGNTTTLETFCSTECLAPSYTCCGCNNYGGIQVCGGCPASSQCRYIDPNVYPESESPLHYYCVSGATSLSAGAVVLIVSVVILFTVGA